MLLRLKATLLALACIATAGLVSAAPASAITGGTVDSTGRYPNVGLVAFYEDGGRFRCTGTLVAPDVVLTAAHCTADTIGKTIITFGSFISNGPSSNLPRAADDAGNGISKTGYQTEPAGFSIGTPHAHPDYSNFTNLDNWNDVGVIVLDRAVTGITPAQLAPTNYLDQFAQPALNHELFRLVGYGTEVRKSHSGPRKPTPQSFPLVRRYTDEVGQKLTPQILQTNGNEHDIRGGGGTCFGDSGGPSLKDAFVTTVTSYGYTSNCRYLGGLQRVDIPGVQAWLADFGVLPASTGA